MTMSKRSTQLSYLDKDVAYFLGLVVGRGRFARSRDFTKVVVSIPNTLLYPQGPSTSVQLRHVADGVNRAVDHARSRLDGLVQIAPKAIHTKRGSTLEFLLGNGGMALRNLLLLCRNAQQGNRWQLHHSVLRAPIAVLQELMRGFADASCNPFTICRSGYMDFAVRNQRLAKQLDKLLQERFSVRTRLADATPGSSVSGRLRRTVGVQVSRRDFLKVGFGFRYKQDALENTALLM